MILDRLQVQLSRWAPDTSVSQIRMEQGCSWRTQPACHRRPATAGLPQAARHSRPATACEPQSPFQIACGCR
jgi:hypothetical protein